MIDIVLIGFKSASLIRDIIHWMKPTTNKTIRVVEPSEFLSFDYESQDEHLVCITRDMELRSLVIDRLDRGGFKRHTFVHDSSWIGDDVSIGAGSWIGPFVTVCSDTKIGSDCLLSPYCMVSHRVALSPGVLMQPYSMVAGSTSIGRCCKLNVRATVLDHLTVGEFVEVGASGMVTKDLPDPGFYVGTPVRRRT